MRQKIGPDSFKRVLRYEVRRFDVKNRNRTHYSWRFPGGTLDPSEDKLGATPEPSRPSIDGMRQANAIRSATCASHVRRK